MSAPGPATKRPHDVTPSIGKSSWDTCAVQLYSTHGDSRVAWSGVERIPHDDPSLKYTPLAPTSRCPRVRPRSPSFPTWADPRVVSLQARKSSACPSCLGSTLTDGCARPRQVAIVLQGRQAGRKVVVIKQLDEGTKERPYPHAIVAGVERYPRKVTRRMGAKKVQRRSRVKPFIKVSFTFHSHLAVIVTIDRVW